MVYSLRKCITANTPADAGADLSRPYIIHNPTNTQQNKGYIIFNKHTTRFIHCVISANTP